MERKFYTENFEKFLKGHADQFKMTPSKKVWHGIYNDLHPGQRWPSIAMSMVFIFTLVIIGHLNTNNGHITALPELNTVAGPDVIKAVKKSSNTKRNIVKNTVAVNNIFLNTPESKPVSELITITNDQAAVSRTKGSEEILKSNTNTTAENINEKTSTGKIVNNPVSANTELTANTRTASPEMNNEPSQNSTLPASDEQKLSPVNTAENNSPVNSLSLLKSKKLNNVTWGYHITPSLSYRFFSDNDVNNAVLHGRIMGYEAGVTMGINLVKKLQFISGFQLNYAGYNIRANNSHPIVASLLLNSETPGQFNTYSAMSHYGNSTGNDYTVLKNYSIQASVPIGLQYGFGGNQNVKYGIAASVQPTFILSSKAYLLSTDKRNYLTDPALFRNWNMNGNFTVFTSFTTNAFNLQIGPQVRYQFLSTYTDRYTVKEHLVNYGIRLGISKISK